jgi:hypothetical protein
VIPSTTLNEYGRFQGKVLIGLYELIITRRSFYNVNITPEDWYLNDPPLGSIPISTGSHPKITVLIPMRIYDEGNSVNSCQRDETIFC